MPHTPPLTEVIEAIWTRCGLDPAPVVEDLESYWTQIEAMAPMNSQRAGDINQVHWDWFGEKVLGALPPGLLAFLQESRGKINPARHPMDAWQAELNAVVDAQKTPLQRHTWVQALIPLLVPVTVVSELPFLRFEPPLKKTVEAPKKINDEIHAALQEDGRHRQRNDFNNGYHERRSALSNAQLHYASLLMVPLMACAEAGLIDAAQLLGEMMASDTSPLRLNHLYPGDNYDKPPTGVPELLLRYLIPSHKVQFLALLPPLASLDTGRPLFRLHHFTTLMEADDDLFDGFLASLDGAFFHQEAERYDITNYVPLKRWEAYAEAAFAHGVILAPWINDNTREAITPGLIDWFRQRLDEGPEDRYLWTLYRFLTPYVPGQMARGFLDAMIAANKAGSKWVYSEYQFESFAKEIADPAVLAEMIYDERYPVNLRKHLKSNYEKRRKQTPWVEFHDMAVNRPELFVGEEFFFHSLPQHDLKLLGTVWRAAMESPAREKLRNLVLTSLLEKRYNWEERLSQDILEGLKGLGREVFEQMPDQTGEKVMESTYTTMDEVLWLEMFGHPLIDRILLKLCAASSYFKDRVKEQDRWSDSEEWFDKVRGIAIACPEDLLSLSPAQLRDTLSLIDSGEHVTALSPHILEQAAATTSSDLHLFLADWLADCPLDSLSELGWLDPKFKRFEALSVELLLRKSEPEALEMLAEVHKRIKNQTLKDRILDKLEAAGHDITSLDELGGLDLAGLDAVAIKKVPKKMRATVKKIWREDLTETFAPLTPALLQWLFLLLEETTADGVPRTAKHILALLDPEQQSLLTLYLFERWFNNKGNAAQEWAVLLLDDHADDRLVPLFLQAVKHWNKKSKTKTNKVIGWLGRLGSTYALSQVKQIYEGRYSESIIERSRAVLTAVAQSRGMILVELFEELTPALDYATDGLVLEVGGQVYHARFDTKGALVVVHENGKQTKAFPTCKKVDDPVLYKAAKAKLSFFKKNLKPILKQQAVNFERYFHQGKLWPAARWQQLFYDHSLLAALGQSLIWDGELAGGVRMAFRISEDMDLLTVDDDTQAMEELETVRLWHPLEWDADTVEAWKTHLKDYQLKAMVSQVDAPVHRLDADALALNTLTHCQGHAANQASFRHILKKNGFVQEATGDGGRFYSHSFVVGARELVVNLHHTAMSAWLELEEVSAIEKVTFYDTTAKQDLTLDRVNPRLIAWMIDILAQVSVKGDGYRDDWRALL